MNLTRLKKKQQSKSEHNYKEVLSILKDNPDIFNDSDMLTLVTAWFGIKATEILDKDAGTLKCGVGTEPGTECIKDKCLMIEVCVHKDRKPLVNDTPIKPEAKIKSRRITTKVIPTNNLGIKLKI